MLASSFKVLSSSHSVRRTLVAFPTIIYTIAYTCKASHGRATIERTLSNTNIFCSSCRWSELDVDMCASSSFMIHLTVKCDLGASWAKLAGAMNVKSVLLFSLITGCIHKQRFHAVRTAANTYLRSVVCTRPTIRHDLACRDIWY